MLNLAINPGDDIEYEPIVYTGSGKKPKVKVCKGKVVQVTSSTITIKGERYPDSILINDLKSGQAKILKLRGEEVEDMAPRKPEAPSKDVLLKDFEKHDYKIDPLAKQYRIGWASAKRWLIEAGIVDSLLRLQTPAPNPVPATKLEPDQESNESAKDIITEDKSVVNKAQSLKIYIAGKITDNPEHKEQFMEAEQKLKEKGFLTMNPTILPPGFEHGEYMKICFSMIGVCDGVYLLNNWRDSVGATMEYEYALQADKMILMGRL